MYFLVCVVLLRGGGGGGVSCFGLGALHVHVQFGLLFSGLIWQILANFLRAEPKLLGIEIVIEPKKISFGLWIT